MGLFDDIRCEAKLPDSEPMDGHYQTKDTPSQYMDLYVIKKDGTLWHEEYDVEDRSDPDAKGAMRFAGCMARVNKRMVPQQEFSGTLNFYGATKQTGRWKEYQAEFIDGKMDSVVSIRCDDETDHRP